jgi:SAM-dependent methyltransferase
VLGLAEGVGSIRAILDAGCGTGELLLQARALYPSAQLMGIDPAEGQLRIARKLVPDALFFASAVEKVPLPDESVDVVLSTFSFHHWSDPAMGVRELTRVLRPGGRMIVADLWLPVGLWRLTPHFWPSNPSRVKDVFVKGGLEAVEQRRRMNRLILATIGSKNDPSIRDEVPPGLLGPPAKPQERDQTVGSGS